MITIKVEGVDKALRALDPSIVRRAAALAINEAATTMRSTANKGIRQNFRLKAARVNQEVRKVQTARRDNLTAVVSAVGRPIGLMNFGARQLSGRGKKRRYGAGVSVKIRRGATTKLKHAFIARGRRGSVAGAGAQQVFQRMNLNDNRSPLVNRSVITIASMMKNRGVQSLVAKATEKKFATRFAHHLKRLSK